MTEEQAHKQAKKEREFYGHLASYLIVNTFFVTLNLLTWEGHVWFIYPMLGWGIGLASHAARVFGRMREGGNWEERRVRELMGADAAVPRLRALVDEAVEAHAPPARLDAGEAERLRRRVEQLEAIVTSRDWDLLEAPYRTEAAPLAERRIEATEEEPESPEARAARLARRVR